MALITLKWQTKTSRIMWSSLCAHEYAEEQFRGPRPKSSFRTFYPWLCWPGWCREAKAQRCWAEFVVPETYHEFIENSGFSNADLGSESSIMRAPPFLPIWSTSRSSAAPSAPSAMCVELLPRMGQTSGQCRMLMSTFPSSARSPSLHSLSRTSEHGVHCGGASFLILF